MSDAAPSRSLRALRNALLVLASTLLALVAAEALARLGSYGPVFGQLIFVRGVSSRTVDGVALWNEKNLRYDPEDIERAANNPGAFTVVGLGDSIMYGVWQTKEDTYLEQARRVLAQRSQRPVEILNLAVPGYNTMQENIVYKEVEGQIQPNLVLVHYWVDDVHQYRVVGGYVVDLGDVSDDGRLVVRALPLPAVISDFLLVHSRLYDLLTQAVVGYRRQTQVSDWTRVSKPLAEIHERVQRTGGRLVVLASADLSGTSADPTSDLPLLQTFAASRGIEVIDLSQWLRGVDPKQIAIDTCHFNAAGHRMIGERLAEYLLQHYLKPSS